MSQEEHDDEETPVRQKISGLGQELIGQVELIGGVLTADPVTQAEGEFNVEVGEIREEIEEMMESPSASDEPLDEGN